MSILHHGFQIQDHDAIYSRMNLISTVPLSVNSQDKQITSVQNLDQTMESVSNVLSKHTRNIDSWLSTQDRCNSKRKKQEVLLPFDRGPPPEFEEDLFISSSHAIEKPNEIDESDKIAENNIPINAENQIKSDEIQSINIDQIEAEPKIEINEVNQNINNYNEEEEEEEEADDTEEADKPQTQRNSPKSSRNPLKTSRNSLKSSRINTEEIEANHRFKSLIKTRNLSPEPCTYDPNFSAVLPTINVPQLPPSEKKTALYSPPKNEKQVELMSSTEVLNMFNTKLRDFSTKNVHIRNFSNLNIHYPNETKNVYDYVYKPKTETETDNKEKAAQLTETESIASSNEPESPKIERNTITKSKSKLSSLNLKKSDKNSEKSKKFKKSNLVNIERNDNFILRPTSTLDSKVPRDEVYKNFSAAKNLGPGQYNLPQPKPPVVLNMSNLHERDCLPTRKGSPRIYPKAVEQADNLRPKKPFHKFSNDTSREPKVVKNRRVQMLDQFKKEKHDLINEICKKSSLMSAKISAFSSKNSSENDFGLDDDSIKSKKRKISLSEMAEDELNYSINKRSKSGLKKRTPFDIQSTRPSFLPGEKNYANDPEPVYPFDPIESFKKLQPEAKFVTIRSKLKPLPDDKFWQTTWYGT